MNLIQKGHRHTHRGIIGIESAIVLIAFVIVAAALAFVVLNMGFSTTQKAKTAIIAAVEEAGSSLEVAGKITAVGHISSNALNATVIPIKVVSGGASSNLDGNFTSVKIITDNIEYDNIYTFGPLFTGSYVNASRAWDAVVANGWITAAQHPYTGTQNVPETLAIIYWTVNQNDNTILESGEHAVLSVAFASNDRPASLEHIAWEVSTPKGAPLTVDRTVPNITNQIIDLG
ncbi:MAG: archaellin/type IV pilin N-terminal domain-containing protein [Nitrosopumilaceae archaeon]